MEARLTLWNGGLFATNGLAVTTTWPEWFAHLGQRAPYKGPRVHPGWSAAVIEPCVRTDANVRVLTALVLDYDHDVTIDAAVTLWRGHFGFLHTTRKHRSDAPRFRVVLPFGRAVLPDEYGRLWTWAQRKVQAAGHVIDASTRNVSRFWYLPGAAEDGIFHAQALDGEPLDPDALLAPERPSASSAQARHATAYVAGAVRRECEELANAPPGTRNVALNRAAFALGRYVASGELAEPKARSALNDAATRVGLPPDEIQATIAKAFRASASQPRSAPEKQPVQTATPAKPEVLAGRPDTLVFERGDHAELATFLLERLEAAAPLTFDDGDVWQYAPPTGVWERVAPEALEMQVLALAGAWVETAKGARPLKVTYEVIRGTARLMRSMLHSRPGRPRFHEAPAGVVFANGFVTVRDGRVHLAPHRAEHLARARLPFDYDPKLSHSRLSELLESTFADAAEGERTDRILLLQEFLGAALMGLAPRYQKALLLFGPGGNGKSQVLIVMRACFPDGALASLSPQRWGERFALTQLVGKAANLVDEMPSREILASEVFKSVITGEPQTTEYKGRDLFSFSPKAAHVFSANVLPTVGDHSLGFFRRLIVLPFTRTFTAAENADEHEIDIGATVVAEERAAIAAWAVEGAARLQRQSGYTEPASAGELKEQWRVEANSALLFLSERCTRVDGSTPAQQVYRAYVDWARDNGFSPFNSTHFGRHATTAGVAGCYVRGRRHYRLTVASA